MVNTTNGVITLFNLNLGFDSGYAISAVHATEIKVPTTV